MMAALIRTEECYPRPFVLFGVGMPAGEPRHADCRRGQTLPGLLGGWACPCPCHNPKAADALIGVVREAMPGEADFGRPLRDVFAVFVARVGLGLNAYERTISNEGADRT